VGTRWKRWVQAVEADERVRSTVSEESSYQAVYEGASKGVVGQGMLEWVFANGEVEDGGGEVMGA